MVRVRPTTSSPPGTRSRRHNGTRQQAKPRLSNGFSSSSSSAAGTTNHKKKSKPDQIRTRSKAAKKNAEASPNSARRKRRELQLRNNSIIINNHTNHANSSAYSATGAELKRLHINMRDKINHSSPIKTSTPNHNRTKAFNPSSARNGNISAISERNGLRKSNKNNISPTSKNENKLNYRHQVLKSYKKKRDNLSRLSRESRQKRRQTKSSEESDDDDGADSENRDRKRRSALWVLNCEAESFVFGETAADKHEVVLPPKSAEPPAKRRRMRATELGDLLKETPLLESKLRKSTSGSEASPNSSSNATGDKALKTQSRKKTTVKRKIFENEESSDSASHPDNEYSSELIIATSPYQTTMSFASGSSCIGSPRVQQDYLSQAVRLQNILENLQFRFSFENVPTNEIWYHTFSRQESPTKAFQHQESPIILPYERSSLSKRALGRLSRLPRKSPRCHASTLAILSSLNPGGRSSRLNSILSTPLSVNCSYDTPTSTSTRSPLHPQRLAGPGPSSLSPRLCSSSSILQQPQSPTQARRRRNVSIQSPPPVLNNSMGSCELTATEYFTDALAFLDDPYVVQLLAEERSPQSPVKLKSIKKAAVPTTRSSQKHQKMTKTKAKLDKNSNKRDLRDRDKDASPNGKQVIPVPKTSPKVTQNGSHPHNSKVNNCVNFEHQDLLLAKSKSPPSSPKHSSSRGSSRPSSPKHPSSRGSSGPSSPQSRPTSPSFSTSTRKSTRKSPIVLVSDIYKHSHVVKSSPAKHGAFNCFGEEVLFQSVDWLPPLLPSLDS